LRREPRKTLWLRWKRETLWLHVLESFVAICDGNFAAVLELGANCVRNGVAKSDFELSSRFALANTLQLRITQ
jgi:hypothetical protein